MFKAFAAEAYVIPTGSMATTLMGRHKDVECAQCGFPFQISASEESNDSAEHPLDPGALPRVLAGTCPQCRFTMYVGPDNPEKQTYLSYNGDRIFVNKCCFNFRKPTRWNVTVFRYPGRPQVNYIKRLVGLENETLRVQNGDVFVKKDDESKFTIQRKPFTALQAMLRPVDDNDYVQPELHKVGWPTRWFFDETSPWTVSEDMKTFRSPNSNAATTWLGFRNIVPSSADWFYLSQRQMPPHGVVNNPQLITDFVGYNSGIDNRSPRGTIVPREKDVFCYKYSGGMGLNWVGDLAVSGSVSVEGSAGTIFLQLVKGGVVFLCEINVADGKATLSISGLDEFQPVTADTPIEPGKTFDVFFSKIDEEMRLAIDGKEIDFGGNGRYDRLADDATGPLARTRPPTELDLTPAAIGIQGAVAEVRHLKVLRDTYYIACDEYTTDSVCDLRYSPFRSEYPLSENTVNRVMATPSEWRTFGKTRTAEFKLDKDQYLMFGDNSARSKDGRLWTSDGIPPYVPSDLLIGEAVFVYWPHGLRIPGTRIALIPNWGKMRFIH
jgi:signal peptidase I